MTKKGHIPIRTCIGCRKKREKKEMIRFFENPDRQGNDSEKEALSGRGFYLCPDLNCLQLAKKKNKEVHFLNRVEVRYPFQKGFPRRGEMLEKEEDGDDKK